MKLRDNYPDGNILWFNDFYLKDADKLIFSTGNFNALYEFSLKKRKLNFLGVFKNENILEKQLYGQMYKYQNKLVFIPLSAVNIGVYDLTNNKFESIDLPFPKMPCGFECKFLNSTIFNGKVFMFPGYASYIIELDLASMKVIVHDDWYRQYIGRWGKKSNLLFNYDMVQAENIIYLPSAQSNGMFKYNVDTNEYQFIDILYEFNKLSTLAYDGEYFWCGTDNGKVIKTDVSGKILEQIDILLKYGVSGSFVNSIYYNGNLWLFFSQTSSVLRIGCSDIENDYEIIKYSEMEKEYTSMEYHTVDFVRTKGDFIFFMSRSDRKLKYIFKDSIEDYSESITDTSGYSEKDVSDVDFALSCIDHTNKCVFYGGVSNTSQVLTERAVFSGKLEMFAAFSGGS